MKIVLFRSNNIFASRVNKYVNFYKRNQIDYTIVGWDRAGEAKQVEHYDFCKYKAPINKGGVKAIIGHSKWMWFVFKYLLQNKGFTTIHACDLNVAFPAAIYKIMFNRNVSLIFDVCDWFSANFAKYPLLCKVLLRMEKFTCKIADHIIICEPERRAQIPFSLKNDPFVLPNIPEVERVKSRTNDKYRFNNKKITIGYFGGFSLHRFLPELLELCKTGRFNLLIAGYGNQQIVDKCNEVSSLNNVKYFGRLEMTDGLEMEANADIIATMYCKTNPNHVYAAPNKLYEALLLGKPILTTKGIIVENKVNKYGIGYAIDESKEDFLNWIDSVTFEDLKEKGCNSQKLWDTEYKDYIAKFFKNHYSRIIK